MFWSIITSKLAGPLASGLAVLFALALAGALLTKGIEIRSLNKQVANAQLTIDGLRRDNTTLKGNADKMEAGLAQCNKSVDDMKRVSDAVSSAGLSALKQVQQAGKSVDSKVAAIDAMPKETCGDAFKILKSQ